MRIFKSIDELPKEDDKFWKVQQSDSLREIVVFRLINELMNNPSMSLTDEQCRSKLAKCESLVELLHLKEGVINGIKENKKLSDINTHDEIPEDQ